MNYLLREIYSHSNKKKAEIHSRFFKTEKGKYGEGDVFLGLTVPVSRLIATKHKDASFSTVSLLLKNKIHEARLIGLLILVNRYILVKSKKEKDKITSFYFKNIKHVNNWDLVDLSAPKILGEYLSDKNKNVLLKLANSKNLWEQRIAIVSTFAFIKKGDLDWTFKIARIFLNHEHDLIHKATGWMLREAGKKDLNKLRKFLDTNVSKMPRTMLRYAIEKFPEQQRKLYLSR